MDTGRIIKIESGDLDTVGMLMAVNISYYNVTDAIYGVIGFDVALEDNIYQQIQDAMEANNLDCGL